MKVQRRALVLIACLIPCHRCKKSARESRNFHHLTTQRENIHARTRDTWVDKRGYMTSGRRLAKMSHIIGARGSPIMVPGTR